MHNVVDKHLAVRQETRTVEDALALHQKLPVLLPRIIRRAEKGAPCLRCAFLENLDQLGCRFKRHRLEIGRCKVQLGSRQDDEAEAGELSYVGRELAQRHRPGVRREIPLVGWNAFQRRPRLLHFFIKFRQQQFADQHRPSILVTPASSFTPASWDACKTASESPCTLPAGCGFPRPLRYRWRSARGARRPARCSSSGTARTNRW